MKGYNIFQSTLPREERLSLSRLIPTHSNFNPRFHERSDVSGGNGSGSGSDFNPRFHERSDRTVDDGGCSIFISIHASTRGATDKGAVINGQITISIHASTRGATLMFGFLTPYFIFQSTLPREERPIRCRFLHAIENFNPRSHERSD